MNRLLNLPDVFTFADGSPVKNETDFQKRKSEIRKLYENEIYGVYPSGETVRWELLPAETPEASTKQSISSAERFAAADHYGDHDTKTADSAPAVGAHDNIPTDGTSAVGTQHTLRIFVSRENRHSHFDCKVYLPRRDALSRDVLHEGGSPVILAMWDFAQKEYVLARDIAVITFLPYAVASDNSERAGVFYEIHPYGENPETQSGALVAWGWAFSKILDALYGGAASEFAINPDNNLITGVSRFGKAAFVAGAFDSRFKITVPACSGAGGTALFRYRSTGDTYDYSPIGETEAYTFGQNEPLGSLQSADERHWFNDRFLDYRSEEELPVDQHLLAALYAGEDRYIFITASYLAEDWTNPPAMWETYLLARNTFERIGEPGHVYFHIHKQGHAVIDEDVELLTDYLEHFLYGKASGTDHTALPDCLFRTLD